jgi:D-lactate dehydrogenase
MKIVVYEIEQWEQDEFRRLGIEHEVKFLDDTLGSDNAGEHADADVVSAFIYSDLSAEVLKQFSHLKLIATRSTGFDHIDIDYCNVNGVTVCNVPSYGEQTVAEHVFGLLLTISHDLAEAIDRTRRGHFSQQGLKGFDLYGKTLGVIGTGAIGRRVIEIAKGFRMEVVAYDVKPDEEFASHLGFRYTELEEVLSTADIITLHVPANEKTLNLVSTKQFDMMKNGVVLINTARGSLIDIQALLRAFADGKVRAAGLDVLPEEPIIREEAELLRSVFNRKHDLSTLLADHLLLHMRNVIVTPHSGFNTREAVQRILKTTVDNISAFAQDKPQNVVVSGSG